MTTLSSEKNDYIHIFSLFADITKLKIYQDSIWLDLKLSYHWYV